MTEMNQYRNGYQLYFNKRNNSFDSEDISKVNNIKLINSKFDQYSSLYLNNSPEKNEEENEIDDFYIYKNNNNIISYYYITTKYLKKSNEYKNYISILKNSKNYIPKKKYNFFERNNIKDNKYNEEYINKYQQINYNCIYEINNNNKSVNFNEQQLNYKKEYINNYINQSINLCNNKVNNIVNNISCNNNHFIEGKEKNINNGYIEQIKNKCQNNIINNIDCPPFVPSNYNNKKEKELSRDSNDSLSKDKESDSTSAVSEKREEENNFEVLDKSIKNNISEKNMEKVEYLVEMFGRKGWICKLCNNFNYETRNKCNRCGIIKKPKRIVDLKQKMDNIGIKERSNKKGDWICINCRNLNYSFRTFCNRCKIPKINNYLNANNLLRIEEINNLKKYPIYSFSPSIIFINNAQNNTYKIEK